MRLELEPRIESGNSFMFSLKAWMRQVAQLLNGTADSSDASAKAITALQTLAAQLAPTGKLSHFARAAAPAGWVAGDGGTIGNVGSGATRANADTLALFTAWWSDYTDALLPILTSAGAASTRGASAAADWAALKRMTVFDVRGRFIRSASAGAINGTAYAATEIAVNGGNSGAIVVPWTGNGYENADSLDGVNASYGVVVPGSVGTSVLQTMTMRPFNTALLGCFKL